MSDIIQARGLIRDALVMGTMDRAKRMRLHRALELMVREPPIRCAPVRAHERLVRRALSHLSFRLKRRALQRSSVGRRDVAFGSNRVLSGMPRNVFEPLICVRY
jgi:hypothetical protein